VLQIALCIQPTLSVSRVKKARENRTAIFEPSKVLFISHMGEGKLLRKPSEFLEQARG